MSQTIVIVGGGATGVGAAYHLHKQVKAGSIDAKIILVERDAALGGKAKTDVVDGMVIEHGPDSYLAYKPWFGNLAKELGLSTVGTNPHCKSTYILHKGRMESLPVGMNIMIPTEVWPFLKTRLLTPLGKLRAGLEPFMPIKKDDADESIGSFVGRRFGRDVLEHVAGPLMGGIHGGDWENVSIKCTFPSFPKMEKEGGSLLLQGWKNKANKPKSTTGSAFQTVQAGLQSALLKAAEVASESVDFRTSTSVTALNLVDGKYDVTLSTGEQFVADAVILAVPAYVAADLVKSFRADVAEKLNEIPYNNSCVVAVAYNKADIKHPLNATGFLVPSGEPLEISASTWISTKWPHAAPDDKVLLRCFVGRGPGKDWTKESDEAIMATVKDSLKQTMGIEANPILTKIFRWPKSMAVYRVGHLALMDKVDSLMAQQPGLYLAGAAYRGVGLGDCVREGTQAADKAMKHLGWKA
ncbi:MAG TPA: protoporphyrinogen oxidase [Symbiobacteriaceae bacterium]|nr:protoporphyrinogen oxidase [Symbiobacteriaceae bacterium]